MEDYVHDEMWRKQGDKPRRDESMVACDTENSSNIKDDKIWKRCDNSTKDQVKKPKHDKTLARNTEKKMNHLAKTDEQKIKEREGEKLDT